MKYHLVPLGCQMNQSDTERIRSVLEAMGMHGTEDEAEADLLGVVACSVRQKAIDRAYSRIAKWNRWKQKRPLLTFVSGCILPSDREKFLDRFDLLFTINELPQLPDLIRQYGVVTPLSQASLDASSRTGDSPAPRAPGLDAVTTSPAILPSAELRGTELPPALQLRALRPSASGPGMMEPRPVVQSPIPVLDPTRARTELNRHLSGFWQVSPDYSSQFEAYVPIQNGCDKFCTFCAVPYTRGREVSRPSDDILGEVEGLVARGYRSITLLGQNVNSYGLDRRGAERSFAELLREIGEIGQRSGRQFWTWFTSPHPRDMTTDVLETIAEYPVLAKQIHLPVQSGDDKVLMRMNRNYGMHRYREVVANIRSILPEATLFTDIIVGFSGETETQFEQTRLLMEEMRYQMAYIAMYSPRPGAASSRWADDVPQEEKKRRLHVLQDVLQETSLEYNRSLIGKTITVLCDGEDRRDGFLSAKTEGRVVTRFASADRSLIGRFVELEITGCQPLSLEGRYLGTLPSGDPAPASTGARV